MINNFIIAIFSNGEAIKLNIPHQLPGCDVITFIRCIYDGTTFSGKNHRYAYTLFDAHLNKIDSNCLEWHGYKCQIDKRDEYRSAHLNSMSNEKMRIEVVIEAPNGHSVTARFKHSNYYGEGFTQLLEFLKLAEERNSLYDAFRAFKPKLY
jgi:hypothetical protein